MNYEERVTKEYVEDAIANAGAQIVTGTYVGDGEPSQFINLGFTPRAVLVVDQYGHMADDTMAIRERSYYGGLALTDAPVYALGNNLLVEIVQNGFLVYLDETQTFLRRANCGNHKYHYLAIT